MSQEGFDLLKKECINSGLCVVCGACSVVCPTKAIQMKRYSWGLNPELCASCVEEKCTKCFDVCPAKEVPLSKIERRFFGRAAGDDGSPASLGVVRNVYTGYAQDPAIHGAAVSGGVASAILVHALERGEIDGAVLASYDTDKGWIAKARVATTKEQILSCGGSKYQPHPQLLGLDEACRMGLKKLAVTATPCHAVAVRKMMMNEEFAEIGSRIKLLISNICAAHWSLHGTEWLITERMGLKLEDVAGLKYRARPFPGDFQVTLRDGSVKIAPFVNGFLSMLGQFTPEECRVCLEKVGYLADIVVGDTWHHPKLCPSLLGKYSDEEVAKDESIARAKNGVTAIITRSELGDSFVNAAAGAGRIKLFPDSKEVAEQFLTEVHVKGKPVANGPVIAARERRGLPTRHYIRD
ncbi:MAG: hypothetical protein A2X49_09915 [Lentisphaerae bacterium GWF2_52_8]|nr:MAG: hypothetical protein A2X49_09915 [Lentisphaerae bacterium GWF2_52_8]